MNEEKNQKCKRIKVKIIESDENGNAADEYPPFACPLCEKGIVSIGRILSMEVPQGILASEIVGNLTLLHYTCDRCDFRVLIDLRSIDFLYMKHLKREEAMEYKQQKEYERDRTDEPDCDNCNRIDPENYEPPHNEGFD